MAFNAALLSTSFQNLNAGTEAATRTGWTGLWTSHFVFGGQLAGSTYFTSDTIAINAAKLAMDNAMVGMCVSGQAATKVQAGIIAWWTRVALTPANYFLGASAIAAPPNLSSIAADLPAVFALNQLEVTRPPACDRLATFFMTKNAGGIATISGTDYTIA